MSEPTARHHRACRRLVRHARLMAVVAVATCVVALVLWAPLERAQLLTTLAAATVAGAAGWWAPSQRK